MPKFTVRKTVTIKAPREKVYSVVRDFQQWPRWSPWLVAEPDCPLDYGDDGKSYRWDGKIVGSGEMEITGEEGQDAIHCRLTFIKPWKSISKVDFTFTQREGAVETTWRMEGSLPFFMFWMTRSMAAFIGMDYQRGLEMLKDYVETGAVPSRLEFVGREPHPGFRYVGVRHRCPIAEVAGGMAESSRTLRKWLKKTEAQPAGKFFSIYHTWDMVQSVTEYTLGIPFETIPSDLPDGLVTGNISACDVYSIRHTGSYRHLGNGWASGLFHERAKIFRSHKKILPFETYERPTQDVPENEAVTVIHFPTR